MCSVLFSFLALCCLLLYCIVFYLSGVVSALCSVAMFSLCLVGLFCFIVLVF